MPAVWWPPRPDAPCYSGFGHADAVALLEVARVPRFLCSSLRYQEGPVHHAAAAAGAGAAAVVAAAIVVVVVVVVIVVVAAVAAAVAAAAVAAVAAVVAVAADPQYQMARLEKSPKT